MTSLFISFFSFFYEGSSKTCLVTPFQEHLRSLGSPYPAHIAVLTKKEKFLKDREGKEQNKSQLSVTAAEISTLKGNHKQHHTTEVAATECLKCLPISPGTAPKECEGMTRCFCSAAAPVVQTSYDPECHTSVAPHHLISAGLFSCF